MFVKGIAVTGFPYSLINTSGEAVTTGTPGGYITKDGGIQTALTNSSVHEGYGQWTVDLTADEMNADTIGLLFTHPAAIPASFTIATYTSSEVTVSISGTYLGDQVGPTAFTSADVLKRVRKITGRYIDAIADELYEVLLNLSVKGLFIKTSTSETTSSGIITLPSNLAELTSVFWDGKRMVPLSWADYLNNQKRGYVKRGNLLYIRPTPTSSVSYTLYYDCYHPGDLNTIFFGMPFFMLVVYGVVAKCFENLGPTFDGMADKYLLKYEDKFREIEQTINTGPPPIGKLPPLKTSEDY